MACRLPPPHSGRRSPGRWWVNTLWLALWGVCAVDGDTWCGSGWEFDENSGGCTKLANARPDRGGKPKEHSSGGAGGGDGGSADGGSGTWQQQTSADGRWRIKGGAGMSSYLLRMHVARTHDECVCVEANGLGAAIPIHRIHATGGRTAALSIVVPPPRVKAAAMTAAAAAAAAAAVTFEVRAFAPEWYSALDPSGARMLAAQRCFFGAGVAIVRVAPLAAPALGAGSSADAAHLPRCMALPDRARSAGHRSSGSGSRTAPVHTLQWRRAPTLPWLQRQLVVMRSRGCTGCSDGDGGGGGDSRQCRTHPAGMDLTLCANPSTSLKPGARAVSCPPGYHACMPRDPAGAAAAGRRRGMTRPQRILYGLCRDKRTTQGDSQRFVFAEGLGEGLRVCLRPRKPLPGGAAASAVVLTPHPRWLRVSADGTLRGRPPANFAPSRIRATLLLQTSSSSGGGGGGGGFGVQALYADLEVVGLEAARRGAPGTFPPMTYGAPAAAAPTAMPVHRLRFRKALPAAKATSPATAPPAQSPPPRQHRAKKRVEKKRNSRRGIGGKKKKKKKPPHVHGAGCQCYGKQLGQQCARCSAILNGGQAGGWVRAVRSATMFWADRCVDRHVSVLQHDECPSLTLLGKATIVLQEGEGFRDPGAVAIAGWRMFGKDVSATVRITCGPVGQLLAPVKSSALQFLLSYTAPSKAGRWSCPRVMRTVEIPAIVENDTPKDDMQQLLGTSAEQAAASFAGHSCTGGRAFVRCGPMCTPTCKSPDPCKTMPMCCTGACVAKCVCEGGSVWSQDAGVCVDFADC